MSHTKPSRALLSGNEAIARGAWEAGVTVATGYPGTPSTEILESARAYGADIYCEWSPNEKVALEVAAGACLTGARAIVTMKHVGLNVAADPLMTLAYIGTVGGLAVCVADDPGMHSSQNEQDTRHYARFGKGPHPRAFGFPGGQGFSRARPGDFRDTHHSRPSAVHHPGQPFQRGGHPG